MNQRPVTVGALLVVAILLASIFAGRAATITWTNGNGGDWSNAVNWSPNQVPLPTDTAVLGTTLIGPLAVPGGATLNWEGSNVMATVTICSNAFLNWSGGNLNYGSLTVALGGNLTILSNATFESGSFLTNYGTVLYECNTVGYNPQSIPSLIYNDGLWNAVDHSILFGGLTNMFINAGTLQEIKNQGAQPPQILMDFVNPGGTLAPSNAIFMISNWTGNGVVHGIATIKDQFAEQVNIRRAFSGTVAPGSAISLIGGVSDPVVVSSNAALNITNGVIAAPITVSSNGSLSLYYGRISGGSVTVEQGGTLMLSGTTEFGFYEPGPGFLTNFGTMIWGENIAEGFGGSVIYNAGTWLLNNFSHLYNESGTNVIINIGLIEQTNNPFPWLDWEFYSDGGTFNGGSYVLTNWIGDGVVNGQATINGTLGGIIAPGSAINFQGSISHPVTISSNAMLTWNGGDLSGASLTVAQGGMLTAPYGLTFGYNGGHYATDANGGLLTNYGTVDTPNYFVDGYGGSVIYNAGLWQVSGGSLFENQFGTNIFINDGILQQVGSGAAEIDWTFANNGQVSATQGPLIFGGAYSSVPAASISLSLGGPSAGAFGQIQFAAAPNLFGGLTVNTENGFQPTPGSVFNLLNYPSASGGFDCMNLDLGDGLMLQPQFTTSNLDMTVISYPTNSPQPPLFSATLPSGLFLQWPASYSGWTLQSATNLSEAIWSPVAAISCGNDVIIPEAEPQQFFRLQQGE